VVVQDQSTRYGAQYAGVYDLIFQRDAAAEATADMLFRLAGGGHPTVVELGVGTGRIALPLARRGARVIGVDTSRELLELAREAAELDRLPVQLVLADMRSWTAEVRADLTYCVCATISMLATADEQLRTLGRAAASTRPGAHVVVETHNPAYVTALHADRASVDLPVPVSGLADGMVMHSRAPSPDGLWHVTSSWDDGSGRVAAEEFSRLTTPDALEALALEVGLVPVARSGDFRGGPLEPTSATYVSTFRVGEDDR